MEWAQVLAIVLPIVLTLVVGFFFNNARINDINNRFDDVNRRFDDVNQRFAEINQRLIEMNQKIRGFKDSTNQEIRGLKDLIIQFLQKEAGYGINRIKDSD